MRVARLDLIDVKLKLLGALRRTSDWDSTQLWAQAGLKKTNPTYFLKAWQDETLGFVVMRHASLDGQNSLELHIGALQCNATAQTCGAPS